MYIVSSCTYCCILSTFLTLPPTYELVVIFIVHQLVQSCKQLLGGFLTLLGHIAPLGFRSLYASLGRNLSYTPLGTGVE